MATVPVTTTVAKPVVPVVKPPTTHKIYGWGTSRPTLRRRVGQVSGPRGTTSMTPELLQALARQRIVNYH